MTAEETMIDITARSLEDLPATTAALAELGVGEVIDVIERLGYRERAIVFRLLPKDRAIAVFDDLPATLQSDLVHALQDEEVAGIFQEMDPDDRVELLDELPAGVATRLLRDLPPDERELTAVVLGYPDGSTGRRMSPEIVTVHPWQTVAQARDRVRERIVDAETIYTLPVVDNERKLLGVVGLRQVLAADPDTLISAIQKDPEYVLATSDEESAARRVADRKRLAMPVVDAEQRVVGLLTVDDALRIIEEAETEDHARKGGVEPLRRPYLSTPVTHLVRSRIVWLLVLAVGATLTVQVLEVFEGTLAQLVVLSLFVPLLIGTGGNTGNQAATTVTRALALEDVRSRDVMKVLWRELRVGASLGVILGALGFTIASIFYGVDIGLVIGLTLLSVCTLAASVGGVMPLAAKAVRADPAVFSNPFITTFVDASGLVIYFLIAKAVLGI